MRLLAPSAQRGWSLPGVALAALLLGVLSVGPVVFLPSAEAGNTQRARQSGQASRILPRPQFGGDVSVLTAAAKGRPLERPGLLQMPSASGEFHPVRDERAPKQPPRPAGPPVARVASGATIARIAPQRTASSIKYAGMQEAPPGAAPQLLPPVHLAPEPADVEPIESPPPIEPRPSPLRPSRRGLSVARNPAPGELTADIALPGDVRPPDDLSAAAFARNGELRFGPGQPANSLAYNLPGGLYCHRPLYFEEFYLERYGRSFGIFQPAVSAAHFFATVPAMPYMMTARPPGVCSYVTGIGPGGQWYPTRPPRSRFSLRGALVEAGVITGLVFILP